MSKTSQENKIVKEESKKKTRKASENTEVNPTVKEEKIATSLETPRDDVIASEAKQSLEEESTEITKIRTARVRGKRYQKVRKLVDANKLYSLKEAVKLVKETSLSKFEAKVEAHVTILDIGNAGEIVFPHLEASSKKIVILNEAILAEIKDGKVNFDILIATPVTMPKLLPFAKLLGPKGLMPNPKSGTLTDKPEEALKKLSVAKTVIKTEKKAPVVHIVVGKVSQPEAELEANVAELIKVLKAVKIKKLALCATMGPSVKIEIQK